MNSAAGQVGALGLGQGVPIAQAGFIPVVAVGDVQPPPGEVLPQGRDGHGVVDDPQPVGSPGRRRTRAGAGRSWAQVFQPPGGGAALRILVEGVDGAEVAPGGGEQAGTGPPWPWRESPRGGAPRRWRSPPAAPGTPGPAPFFPSRPGPPGRGTPPHRGRAPAPYPAGGCPPPARTRRVRAASS